jgi:hypothetical protein
MSVLSAELEAYIRRTYCISNVKCQRDQLVLPCDKSNALNTGIKISILAATTQKKNTIQGINWVPILFANFLNSY